MWNRIQCATGCADGAARERDTGTQLIVLSLCPSCALEVRPEPPGAGANARGLENQTAQQASDGMMADFMQAAAQMKPSSEPARKD